MAPSGSAVVVWNSFGQDGHWWGVYGRLYDFVAPTIEISGPSPGAAINGSVSYTVTFSGADEITLSESDVTLNATGDAWGDVVVSGSGDTRTVTISNITGEGSLGISIDAGTATALGASASATGVSTTFQFGTEFQVNSYTDLNQNHGAVSCDADGNFVVVWGSDGQDGDGVFGQRYNATGEAQGSEFQVNTTFANAQSAPDVAMDADGDFVVVWRDAALDGSGWGIFGQRYSTNGEAVDGEFQVNTNTSSDQSFPYIGMDDAGNFVVIWRGLDQDGSGSGTFGQRYAAAGTRQGDEFGVNTYTDNNQSNGKVAMDGDGNFVVVWSSFGQDGDDRGVYGQRYDAAGTAQGEEFQINTWTAGTQSFPSVAMDGEGNFVVAWRSRDQDGSGYGIYGQRYNAQGETLEGEFQVNTETGEDQQMPWVAMDDNGRFFVTWESSGEQDGSEWGVYGQRYDASGAPVGGEIPINGYTDSEQSDSCIATDGNGNYVATWTSDGQDGNGLGVFCRLLDGVPPLEPNITSPNGGIDYTTNDSSPVVISGTCKSDTETIEVNGSTDYVTFSAGSTSWTYTSLVLTEGASTFEVTAADSWGNTSEPASINVTLDTDAPTITISPAFVGGAKADGDVVTANGLVYYTITYSGAETILLEDLFATHVTLNSRNGATGDLGLSGTGNTLTVTVSNTAGNGTLGLVVAEGTASDAAGNYAPSATSETFMVDNTLPTIYINSPVRVVDGTVTYTIDYGGAQTVSLKSGHITLHRTDSANGVVTIEGDGITRRTVTISSITGNGTLGISIAADTARDAANNAAPAIGPSETFSADSTAPTLEIGDPSVSATTSGPVEYSVTYHDATSITLTAENVILASTGGATGVVTVSNSGNPRTVSISNIKGDGTLGIIIAAGTASDDMDNLASASSPSTTFIVDNTPPTVTIGEPELVVLAKTQSGLTTASRPVSFTVTSDFLIPAVIRPGFQETGFALLQLEMQVSA